MTALACVAGAVTREGGTASRARRGAQAAGEFADSRSEWKPAGLRAPAPPTRQHPSSSSSSSSAALHVTHAPSFLLFPSHGLIQLWTRPCDSSFTPSQAAWRTLGEFSPSDLTGGADVAQVLDIVGGQGRAFGQRGDGERAAEGCEENSRISSLCESVRPEKKRFNSKFMNIIISLYYFEKLSFQTQIFIITLFSNSRFF